MTTCREDENLFKTIYICMVHTIVLLQCLGGCNRPTKHVNILLQTHYMDNMFRLYHLAILRPHTETYKQNI
jgi:hypothetical protein